MSALFALYIGLCAGFCIGMCVAALFGTPRIAHDAEARRNGYQPKDSSNASRINPPPRRP